MRPLFRQHFLPALVAEAPSLRVAVMRAARVARVALLVWRLSAPLAELSPARALGPRHRSVRRVALRPPKELMLVSQRWGERRWRPSPHSRRAPPRQPLQPTVRSLGSRAHGVLSVPPQPGEVRSPVLLTGWISA